LGIFQDTVLQTICLGWLQIAILLFFASIVAGINITSVSHWPLAKETAF
jgi:hypothetical protein